MNFRYPFKELIAFAKGKRSWFRKRPKGRRWERLVAERVYPTRGGRFELIATRPTVIKHATTVYTITPDHIEISIPDEEVTPLPDPERHVYVGFRLAIFSASFGLTDMHRTFERVKRHEWVKGKLVRVDPRIRDTDTLAQFPTYHVIVYPDYDRMLRYILKHPGITMAVAERRIAELLGIAPHEARTLILKGKAEAYIEEVIFERFPRRWWYLVAVREVAAREGELSFTALRRELTKYRMTYRETFDVIMEALDKELLREGKYARMFTTPKGRAELARLPTPRIVRGLKLTKSGWKRVFKIVE